ncbi:CDP-alcohol phosphatidyltransferase family protein [Thermus tengchongensis]|uniref:CDP-alcohol phosphatidyltransferase family protein n=1 Tax=Thermus tengchongensis TaxID=1214928 RepID=A0A4Y9F9P0_9DEIN|nr:CDP-alcohol phosphatidyltransferase family protein [Thermus tengchongensis]TFU25811.1 CDP-alcohol phosphatidyltransferase family protein [Thermus tengchongensis]
MSYPYLPWDSKEIATLRKRVQKPYLEEEFLAWMVYRRISIYITVFLNSALPSITPNMVTLSAVLLTILSSTLPWLLGGSLGILLAALVMHIAYVLDLVDGELARLRGQFSRVGVFLDRLITAGVVAGMASIGAYSFYEVGWKGLVGVWIAALVLQAFGRKALSEGVPTFRGDMLGSESLTKRFLAFLIGHFGYTTVLLVVELTNAVEWYKVTMVYMVLYLLLVLRYGLIVANART